MADRQSREWRHKWTPRTRLGGGTLTTHATRKGPWGSDHSPRSQATGTCFRRADEPIISRKRCFNDKRERNIFFSPQRECVLLGVFWKRNVWECLIVTPFLLSKELGWWLQPVKTHRHMKLKQNFPIIQKPTKPPYRVSEPFVQNVKLWGPLIPMEKQTDIREGGNLPAQFWQHSSCDWWAVKVTGAPT